MLGDVVRESNKALVARLLALAVAMVLLIERARVLGLIVGLLRLRVEVLLVATLVAATASTSTVSTTASAAASAAVKFVLIGTTICEALAEVVVVRVSDGKKLNKAAADVLLVLVVVGVLSVLMGRKSDNSFAGALAIGVFADFDGVLDQIVAVEELLDVVI